ncbi:sulfite exporter TauE/SafE family protein [Brachybacterium squillarum]|uniref:sulfite exporter TauE/SafE family protein n=1 Tax=Brachybacterium squillarum TaxID=661979 RepID=UPI002222FDA0|nr:sulfite exporter TauE/SafE family protein [Brachybacterium squillarum]MCW1804401.1 sulfite exporter TauE/SafE family protein [Brachybacterium squillarum]
MDPLSLLVLLVMGTLAGAINAAVGSGSLLTLPVLLALGIPPGTAVRTNTIGILFSTIGSVTGYRREIAAEGRALVPLIVTTAVLAATGSVLLLLSPSDALDVVVPVLIVVALLMVVFQKRVTRAISARRERRAAAAPAAPAAAEQSPYRSPALLAAMGGASVYGGYFTAAQGILYLGVLGAFTGRPMGKVNHVKNLASLVVNGAAATVYLVAHVVLGVEIVWIATAAIAVGALLGGYFGAHLAKKLPEGVLRGIIVLVAIVALVRQVL